VSSHEPNDHIEFFLEKKYELLVKEVTLYNQLSQGSIDCIVSDHNGSAIKVVPKMKTLPTYDSLYIL